MKALALLMLCLLGCAPTPAPPQDKLAPPLLLGSSLFDEARTEALATGNNVLIVLGGALPPDAGNFVVCKLPPNASWDGQVTNGQRFNYPDFPVLLYDMTTQQLTPYEDKP